MFSGSETLQRIAKSGGIKYHMPCWSIAELQVVGAHVAAHCDPELEDLFAPEAYRKQIQ